MKTVLLTVCFTACICYSILPCAGMSPANSPLDTQNSELFAAYETGMSLMPVTGDHANRDNGKPPATDPVPMLLLNAIILCGAVTYIFILKKNG